MKQYFTPAVNYYKNTNPNELIKEFGSPLYVYNEDILRAKMQRNEKISLSMRNSLLTIPLRLIQNAKSFKR